MPIRGFSSSPESSPVKPAKGTGVLTSIPPTETQTYDLSAVQKFNEIEVGEDFL